MPVLVYNEAGEALKEISAFIDQSGNRRRVKNIFVADEVTGIYKPVYQYDWGTSEWGECSAPCGGGTQTRDVFCLRHDGVALPDVYCDEAGEKPEASMICNTQSCSVGGQDYKCFVTHRGGCMPVKRAYSVSSYRGLRTNYSWPYPIPVLNPAAGLVPPITMKFHGKYNARFGDRTVSGTLRVETEQGVILNASAPTRSGCCSALNGTVTIDYIPEYLNLFFTICTSKSDQGMALELSYNASNPLLTITDSTGKQIIIT